MGGGAINVPAATKGDIQALAMSLQHKLQTSINAWLKGQLHKGDIAGTLVPNVLASATPLPQEQLTQVPKAGQPLTGISFTGQLSVHISVLVVRYADLLTAVENQMNSAAQNFRPVPYMLATQLPIILSKPVSKPSKDGTSISIALSAKGQRVPKINTDDIRSLVVGKTKDQATSDINDYTAKLGVQGVNIVVTPSFLNLMPFRSEHINIVIQPGQPPSKG